MSSALPLLCCARIVSAIIVLIARLDEDDDTGRIEDKDPEEETFKTARKLFQSLFQFFVL